MPAYRPLSLIATIVACLALSACGAGACAVGFGVERAEPDASQDARAGASRSPDDPERPKIVAFGDSLTAGYGLLESQSYPARLQELIDREGYDFEIVNAGVSGDTSAGALRRIDWALDDGVRVVIVALGGNDALRGLSVDEMQQNLSRIIARARQHNAVVILAGMEAPPNYGPEYTTAFRRAFRDLAQRERVLFIPFLLDGVAGHSALNLPDGIHPNEQGARIIAETVWSVLRPILDQMNTSS